MRVACDSFPKRMNESPTILGRLLQPVTESLTVEVARKLVQAKADPVAEARLTELRSRANEGELSDSERAEYTSYVQAINLVGILQAKARRVIAEA